MSDSVDRVFVHALNTVKKIPRTGSARPPPADRLKLYGLYKQSMEGNVEGVMDRPIDDGADVQAEREKWYKDVFEIALPFFGDAWYAQRNLSRTEAKRRYITTLIETMHRYAAPTPEGRELISELEFVWDQIKSNTASSSSSSPVQIDISHLQSHRSYGSIGGRIARADDNHTGRYSGRDSRLRVLGPVSQPEEQMIGRNHHEQSPEETQDNNEEEEDDEEEFQEARDSFYGDEEENEGEMPQQQHIDSDIQREKRRRRWRRRVEQALTKMTAEVAAMRELMDTRAHHDRRKRSIWMWLKWLAWVALRQLCWDIVILGMLCVWMRLRGDRRLEERIKYLWGEFRKSLARVRFLRHLPLAVSTG
ncbi:hypothetical protein PRK78_001286 [Emydomyces testavorans]|uniref:ACB domain-containing protein n=1 Tax=Emydomyces testavorans TaxID=2070801 RepID=A0AAF0DCP3_9EURO|nr:hypothetical protein PRK78_001286 [Emydomyces testavorans]